MSNGWLTPADTFDPAGTLLKIQQIKRAEQERELMSIRTKQARQAADKAQAFENWRRGMPQQPVQQPTAQLPPQAQAMPRIDPRVIQEQQAAMRGQKKMASMMERVTKEYSGPQVNGNKINRLNQIKRSDSDIRSLIKSTGFDDIDFGYDEEKKTAWERYTKDWTKEELEKVAESVPGGQAVAGLPAGKYTLEFDPISKTMRPTVQTAGSVFAKDTNLTENEIIARAVEGDPAAKRWMDAKLVFEKQKSAARSGELTDDAKKLFAKYALIEPAMLSKLGRASRARIAVANEMETLSSAEGLKMPDLTMKRVKYNALAKSYNKMKVSYSTDQKFAEEFYTDIARLKPQIEAIRTNYPSLVNASLKRIREIAATPLLGQEAVFAQELDAITKAYARVTLDASSSISELSATAQENYKRLINPQNPARVLFDQVDMLEISMKERLGARQRNLDELESQLREISAFEKTPGRIPELKTKRTIKRTGRTKDGRRVIEYSDGSREYVQ